MCDSGQSEFLRPNLPPPSLKKKKSSTMHYLQDDADGIFEEANSSSLPSITIIEGDFKKLSQRMESTSTPCTARTLPSVFNNKDTPALSTSNDSGFSQSTSVTMSSSFNSQMCSSDYASISEMYNIPRSRSNSCSSDSAFGEGSSCGHSQPLSDYSNSQISDCALSNAASLESLESDLDLNTSDMNEDVLENSVLPKCVQREDIVTSSKSDTIEDTLLEENCDKCQTNETKLDNDKQQSSNAVIDSKSTGLRSKKLQNVQKSLLTPYNEKKFTIFMERFSPREPDRLIGRKMGVDELDIITELTSRQLVLAVDIIFHHLEAKDLARMCCVSRNWRDAVYSASKANKRRQAFVNSFRVKKDQKENPVVKCKVNRENRGLTKSKGGACSNVQYQAEAKRPPPISPEKTHDTYTTFYKEGLKLKNNESFRKCPKCFKPAKADEVQERACCVAIMCKFDFCIKCLRPFHGSKACNSAFAKKTKTDGSVGSRASKKNLRRL